MEDNENVGILVLESKSLRPFKTKDEYLDAMKEDLAEWFSTLYKDICISAENFFEGLETGVLLCQHANNVRRFAEEQKSKGDFELKSNFAREIEIPQYDVQFKVHVKPGTFPARDNISNFITWTAKMGIPEVLRFETDDLVLRKNEGSVVLCLLEVARIGAKFGMLAPTIVQMEEEIDNEIETGEPPPQIKTCDLKSLDEMVRELVGRCTCPIQFPIVKVGEGKYKIGDSQTLVFVRILRSHVMIRVGGGWDTLEHYLDRHDPCRCGFQGSRIGKNVHSTPRRSSQPVASSKPWSNTPKSPRKLSLAAPLITIHSGKATHPVSPGMRSASPGPNSRKLSLPSKCILSGSNGISLNKTNNEMDITIENTNSKCATNRQLTTSGPEMKLPVKQNISKSGPCNSESFVKQSQTNLMRELSLTEIECPKNHTSRIESCSRASLLSQSPVARKSDSQDTYVNGRIRSPSPAPSNHNSENVNLTPSVSAAKQCSSPMKQITLSELRLSREGRLATSPNLQSSSTDSSTLSKDTGTEMMSDSNGLNFTMEKISTMSLVEFRSLLDSALSVSNGNSESQYSSDSPRSQSSVESGRYMNPMTTSTSAKRSSGNRPVYGTNNVTSKPKQNSYINSKSYLNNSTSAYSSLNNVSTDKIGQSSLLSKTNTTTHEHDLYSNENGGQSPVTFSRNINNSNVPYHQSANNLSGNSVTNRTQTSSSVARTKANASVKESYLPSSSRSTFASKSSSCSSLHSYESIDDAHNSLGIETTPQSDRVPTLSSVESELSFKTHSGPLSDVHDAGHSLTKLKTSCSGTGNCYQSDNARSSTCSSKESKELIFRDNQIYGSHCSKPLNVGYATFSHDEATDSVHLHGRNEVQNTNLISCKNTFDKTKRITSPSDESQSEKYGSTSPYMPSGRQTPSFIPRPITPKLPGKISLPQTNDTEDTIVDDNKNRCRPPTPRKSNVIARAHNTDTSNQGPVDALKKRSSTPGPGSAMSTTTAQASAGRSLTPGPYLHKTSTLKPTSATASRSSLNEALAKTGGAKLSIYNGENDYLNTSGQQTKTQSFENTHLSRHSAKGHGETVIMVDVDRAKCQHIIAIQGETEVKSVVNTSRPKVLARARAEDSRTRPQNKTMPNATTQRSKSVEPKKLMSRSNSGGGYTLAETPNKSVDHKIYDRTQEWVQTAAEQTVQKNKVSKSFDPRARRAMTPNSFDKNIHENNEPRSLEEIKAALQLPINALNAINIDQLEAPPEDPETFAKMEKLFNEYRMQELKNSVNETPGSTTGATNNSKTKSSQSSSSNNDDSVSVDCKINSKRKIMVTSAKPPPNVSQSMVSPNTTKSTTNSDVAQKTMSNKSIVSSNSWSNAAVLQTSSIQQIVENLPKSDVVTGRPPSPRTKSHPPRPASPRTMPQPARPASPRVILKRQLFALTKDSAQTVDTAIPSTIPDSSQTSAVRTQPPRPASTPPRSSSSTGRQSSKSTGDSDNVFETDKKGAGNILNKIKEIIKVNPRKDKSDGVTNKTKIPAPKSLASMGRSRSFSNLSSASHSMSVYDEDSSGNSDVFNGYSENINGALNVTLSGKPETPGQTPKWNTPLTTGRSSLIRKESMEKNKTSTGNHLVRAVSVERNMSGLKNTYTSYKDEEYV